MKARDPIQLQDGQTFPPSVLATNFRALSNDIRSCMDKRYTYSSFTLDFSGLTDASAAALLTYTIPFHVLFDIVGIELVLYAATTNLASVTLTPSIAAAPAVTVVPAGATTKASSTKSCSASVISTAATFTLSAVSSGAFTLTACKAVVHIRTDRGNLSNNDHTPYNITELPTPGRPFELAPVNTEFTNAGAALDRDLVNDQDVRIEVYTWRDLAPGALASTDIDFRIPANGRVIDSMGVGLVCAATSTAGLDLRSPSASVLGTTLVGAGITTLTTGLLNGTEVTQTGSYATGPTTDYVIRLSRSAGTDALLFVYAVLYWT